MARTRTLAYVVAHPDDDAYGVAGTVALHAADPDFRFVLIHATDGEAGDIRDGFHPGDAGHDSASGGRGGLARARPSAS